jgi:hypothetical protein
MITESNVTVSRNPTREREVGLLEKAVGIFVGIALQNDGLQRAIVVVPEIQLAQ